MTSNPAPTPAEARATKATDAQVEAACEAYCTTIPGAAWNAVGMKEAINAALALSLPPPEAKATEDVLAERHRQVSAEGWSVAHDDTHTNGELAEAAACYASNKSRRGPGAVPGRWPWDREWWKPKDRRRDLVRAGALILAEIERLDRKESNT